MGKLEVLSLNKIKSVSDSSDALFVLVVTKKIF